MKILVCMKQVVETETAKMGDGFVIDRSKSPFTVNAADCAALEQALLIKEKYGAEITVMTMGPETAENILREAAALDVDNLVLLTDRKFAGSDTLSTSRILARAAKYLGGFDLIFMGRRAIDGETGHVGPEVAVMLEAVCVTNVTDTRISEDGSIWCKRLTESKEAELKLPCPAVVTICGGANKLRPAGILGMRKAKTAVINKLSNEELGIDVSTIGLHGSPTCVKGLVTPEHEPKHPRWIENAEEGADVIIETVLSMKKETAMKRVCVISERPEGKHAVCILEDDPDSLAAGIELLTHCRNSCCDTAAVLAGEGKEETIQAIKDGGAQEIYVVKTSEKADDMFVANAIAEAIKPLGLKSMVFAATVRGRAVAPMLAAICELGITADCTEIKYEPDGTLRQIRPTFGGTKLAEIISKTEPQLATVRPGVYPLPEEKYNDCEAVHEIVIEGSGKIETLAEKEFLESSISEAEGIFSGGKVLSKEDFADLKKIAEKYGYAVGASRAAVDLGNIEFSAQVGQTGTVVRPEVYIALGISGAIQHIAGMKDAGFVITVNPDKKAPIYDYSDIGILCDYREVMDIIMQKSNLQ